MSEHLGHHEQASEYPDVAQPSKKELREYTKKQDTEHLKRYGQPRYNSRQAIAREALRLRGQYRDLDDNENYILQSKANEEERMASHTVERGRLEGERLNVKQKAEELQARLQEYETSLVKQIMATLRPLATENTIESIQQELLGYVGQAESIEWLLENEKLYITIAEEQLARLQGELERIHELKEQSKSGAYRYIDDYYEMQTAILQIDRRKEREYLELEEYKKEHGSVEAQIIERGHYLVHGVYPKFDISYSNNRKINNQSDWRDRMAYALLEQPTMCTSSFRHEGGEARLWSPFGLVVSGGVVESAQSGDGATTVDKEGVRRHSLADSSVDSYRKSVATSLAAGSYPKYNEIIASSPRSTAAYINLDRRLTSGSDGVIEQNSVLSDFNETKVTVGDVLGQADAYNLPLVLFDQGKGYLAKKDELTGVVYKGRPVSPQEIAGWRWQPPKDMDIEAAADRVRGNVLAVV